MLSAGASSCIYLFYKYSLSIYYVPVSGVGTEKTVRKKIRPHFCSLPYPLVGKVLPPDGQIFQVGFCTTGFGWMLRPAVAVPSSQPE